MVDLNEEKKKNNNDRRQQNEQNDAAIELREEAKRRRWRWRRRHRLNKTKHIFNWRLWWMKSINFKCLTAGICSRTKNVRLRVVVWSIKVLACARATSIVVLIAEALTQVQPAHGRTNERTRVHLVSVLQTLCARVCYMLGLGQPRRSKIIIELFSIHRTGDIRQNMRAARARSPSFAIMIHEWMPKVCRGWWNSIAPERPKHLHGGVCRNNGPFDEYVCDARDEWISWKFNEPICIRP